MGKKERLRKAVREEQIIREKEEINYRRQERIKPALAAIKRVTMALIATGALLYVGTLVVARLPEILSKITQTMQ